MTGVGLSRWRSHGTVALQVFGRRSARVVRALDDTLFGAEPPFTVQGPGRPPRVLRDEPPHGGQLVPVEQAGVGLRRHRSSSAVGALCISTAVQASAACPVGSCHWTLHLADGSSEDPVSVVLSDGGVYDNMADAWEWGFSNRCDDAAKTGLTRG